MLSNDFVDQYRQAPSPFGGVLGEVTYYRTYSRIDNPSLDGTSETWTDTCRRVIDGMSLIERDHALLGHINYSLDKAERAAQEAFDLMHKLYWSPPGRGLWSMGTDFVHERGEVGALQNCAFVSTERIAEEKGKPFAWLMNQTMLGVGVGFDVRGASKVRILAPDGETTTTYVVSDTREGWADSTALLIDSYLSGGSVEVNFDYSRVRPEGQPIKGFGGVASGPAPLKALHETMKQVLNEEVGNLISSRTITDLMNLIGRCVVSGNVRRSAEIAIGEPTDEDFVSLKDADRFPERNGANGGPGWGWLSNNSVLVTSDTDIGAVAVRTWTNGEPGFLWLDNVHNYERMNKVIDTRDDKAIGFNPCGEQPLEDGEMCTLTEIYLPNIPDRATLRRVIKHAYRYAKVVTIASEQIKGARTREVMMRNRRIGLSMTGITQFLAKHGMDELISWLNDAYAHVARYDKLYSQWYRIPQSIRMTSVKPSGTVSTMAGVTPGVHFSVAGRYYMRRINLPARSPLMDGLAAAGYHLENSVTSSNSVVASFPVDMGADVQSEQDVSLEYQIDVAAVLQRYWSGNAVSFTGKFQRDLYSPDVLANIIGDAGKRLKALSLLPLEDDLYPQMPYEAMSAEDYDVATRKLSPINVPSVAQFGVHEVEDAYCDGEACEVPA
jgi:adenosylcobalamin-dependent ribonucleoside-triphosphate reductase